MKDEFINIVIVNEYGETNFIKITQEQKNFYDFLEESGLIANNDCIIVFDPEFKKI